MTENTRTCPFCKSENTVSKGSQGNTKRYKCEDCGRTHSRNKYTGEVMTKNKTEVKEIVPEVKKEKAKPNISISEDTLAWIQSMKLIPQEPYDSVLQRIKKQVIPEVKSVDAAGPGST